MKKGRRILFIGVGTPNKVFNSIKDAACFSGLSWNTLAKTIDKGNSIITKAGKMYFVDEVLTFDNMDDDYDDDYKAKSKIRGKATKQIIDQLVDDAYKLKQENEKLKKQLNAQKRA